MQTKFILGIIIITWLIGSGLSFDTSTSKYPYQLSEYGFFKGELKEFNPAERVIPYSLNTPLFSDYTEKLRFIYFPEGTQAQYDAEQVLEFPIGTHILKTFYYPIDARKAEKGKQLMETRVLIHEEIGWTALPYVWDEEQEDAYLDVAGDEKEVVWRDDNGKKQQLAYSIPNKNQCKGCHLYKDEIKPIGPSARQLNGDFKYTDGTQNQLEYWNEKGLINNLPPAEARPRLAVWDNSSLSIDQRARAYLDANCGHCHNPDGPANTSGLYLHSSETDVYKLGLNKAPIAAGRGAGDRDYNIVAGKPNASILVYRMESTDPGVMMPELSRKMVHQEGIDLIREWIKEMEE